MKTKTSIFTRAALSLFAAFALITVITLRIKLNELKEQKAELEVQLAEYSEKTEKLQYELSLSDEEYIEKYAREVLGYHKNGEIIFKNSSGN